MMKFIILACLLAAIHAAPSQKECSKIMRRGGISTSFAKHVSHAIHSLTIEDIDMYFAKGTVEDNHIPVVNPHLRSQPRILENAPYMGYDDEFVTDGMKHFDVIMKGVNLQGWQLSAFGLLERLSHVYHMSEIWAAAGQKYKRVARRLEADSDVCQCVTDIDNNGLRKYLELTAFQIRYPGITSGNSTITDTYLGGFLDYHISYGLSERPKDIVKALMDFDFTGTDEELIPRVVYQLVDVAAVDLTEHHDEEEEMLHSREHWDWCVGMLKSLMTPELIYDTAVFMYCRLNGDGM